MKKETKIENTLLCFNYTYSETLSQSIIDYSHFDYKGYYYKLSKTNSINLLHNNNIGYIKIEDHKNTYYIVEKTKDKPLTEYEAKQQFIDNLLNKMN